MQTVSTRCSKKARGAVEEPGYTQDTRDAYGTGKKTPGGAGTHTGHADLADAQDTRTTQTNLTTIQTHQQHTTHTSARRSKPRPTGDPTAAGPEPTTPRGRLRTVRRGLWYRYCSWLFAPVAHLIRLKPLHTHVTRGWMTDAMLDAMRRSPETSRTIRSRMTLAFRIVHRPNLTPPLFPTGTLRGT